MTVKERIENRIKKNKFDCWVYYGAMNKKYERLKVAGKDTRVHRAYWEIINGPIENNISIYHTCKGEYNCVNPKHLILGTVKESIESRINKNESSCWLWKGTIGLDGYGKIGVKGKTKRVHRVYWEIINGPIPKDMLVCHRCDVPICINPKHLFLGTNTDNMKDMLEKKRCPAKNKKQCKHGHLFNKENTYYSYHLNGNIRRHCRCCNRLNAVRYRKQRKANG